MRTTCRASLLALAVTLGLLTAAALPAVAEEAPSGSVPFPVGKTQTLRGKGTVYVIDGAVVIPKKVEISVELDTKILGIRGASLEVRGALKVRGTQDHWVEIRNVDFSPTVAPFKGLHLDMVNLYGCKFVQGRGHAFEGIGTIENACMQRDCEFDVAIKRGELNLLMITWGVPCTIRLEPPAGEKPSIIVQCHSSLLKKTSIKGRGDVRVRNASVNGGLTLENMLKLTVDGCDINTGLVISQPADGTFKAVKLTKCNMWTGSVIKFSRPAAPKQKKERVFLQKFFFGAKDGSQVTVATKAIHALVSSDSESVKPRFDKARKRMHKLVNYDIMDTRVPMLGR